MWVAWVRRVIRMGKGDDFLITVIPFQDKYRDDMLYCLLSAKDAIGRQPSINEDLFDIPGNYFAKGDMFWLAIDENERVVGMLGVHVVSLADIWLKRLYVKPLQKRKGIGSILLMQAEEFAISKGMKKIHTQFSDDYKEAAIFYPSKGFVVFERKDGLNHLVKSLSLS